MTVAVYTRISSDPSGRREGVDAQEQWGRAYAAEAWPGVSIRVFTDNDVSAASRDRDRPGFAALREAVRAGQVSQLWAVEQSRLTRDKVEWFDFSAELVDAGITKLHTKRGGIVDLDEVVGDIMALLDAYEVRRLRKRLLDKKNALAHEGRLDGDLGFGYRSVSAEDHERRKAWMRARLEARRGGMSQEDASRAYPRPSMAPLIDEHGRKRVEVVEVEAEALRQAAERILDGWTLTAIAEDFNSKGFMSGRGGEWTPSHVRRTYERASLAGIRSYKGEELGKATWHDVAILDEATWRAVNAKLSGRRSYTRANGTDVTIPAEHPKARRGVAQQHLLTSVAECGVCGAPLAGVRAEPNSGRSATYRCFTKRGGRACVMIYAEPLEAWVRDRLFDKLDQPGFLAAVGTDDYATRRGEITDALDAIVRQRKAYLQRLRAGKLKLEEFDYLNDGLIDNERQLGDALAELAPPPTGAVDLSRLREAWAAKDHPMTFDERRHAVVTCIDRVKVHRAYKGTNRVTSNDVAQRAGVSRATVTYAMNGNGNMSDATRERVLAVAADMGYTHVKGSRGRGAVIDDKRVEVIWRDSR